MRAGCRVSKPHTIGSVALKRGRHQGVLYYHVLRTIILCKIFPIMIGGAYHPLYARRTDDRYLLPVSQVTGVLSPI